MEHMLTVKELARLEAGWRKRSGPRGQVKPLPRLDQCVQQVVMGYKPVHQGARVLVRPNSTASDRPKGVPMAHHEHADGARAGFRRPVPRAGGANPRTQNHRREGRQDHPPNSRSIHGAILPNARSTVKGSSNICLIRRAPRASLGAGREGITWTP